MEKVNLRVDGGCDEHWNISLEEYNKGLYTMKLEQLKNGETINIEQFMDNEDLRFLAGIIEQVRK